MNTLPTLNKLVTFPAARIALFLLIVFVTFVLLVEFSYLGVLWERIGFGLVTGVVMLASYLIQLSMGYLRLMPLVYSVTFVPFLGSTLGAVTLGIGGELGTDVTRYTLQTLYNIFPSTGVWVALYIAINSVWLAYTFHKCDFVWNAGFQNLQSVIMTWYYAWSQRLFHEQTPTVDKVDNTPTPEKESSLRL